MFKGRITDIFFDLDHTLWDFEKNSALTFEKILKENRIDVPLEDFLKTYIPINLEYWKLYREDQITKSELRFQRLKKTFDAIDAPVSNSSIDKLAHEYIAHLSSFSYLFPHTIEVLDYLTPNYALHIITNGFQEIQEKKLKGSNIHHYFEHIINSETAGVKKPHPYIFELALSKANVAANNALMIGDSIEADIIGAKSVGFHVLHFNAHKESKHDLCKIIDNLIEIKSIL
ncbi:noncanonical pyrimidine nucleotidase, YjjG family [Flagellimonas hymeniacidonis]|uniref:Noncanonical pyrimidine nucleotidase, YjjG family n=1 Tax=Flagellimonas hymeniacidonis TaxID=2603628 RepID=A0A5C8V0D7_9FLAO|nr:YjjG family noncanonical pyrimidine nucleotidase [Flagellimonas hymeniacidonis]TXN34776.1 noncanonical pyrimidine nucleotidase, YjjG family [Flagellimonas hymeniacidonis]